MQGSTDWKIRAVREARGLGLRQLAREASVDPARLSRIERLLERPTVDELRRIGRVLDLKNVVATIDLFWPEAGVRGG
jgi:transcriptional regulator with XRE-family HTH domain